MPITASRLGFRYPAQSSWALDDINIDIAPGAITWLTGVLGSGTSTLLMALAGLAPSITGGERRGDVSIDGRDPALGNALANGIALLGPSPALQISGIARTVRDEVAVGPMNLGQSRDAIHSATSSALQRLQLQELADRSPMALSGGETQRMLIAALLATSPAVWLLDEPFSALDRTSRVLVQELLAECAARGVTVVVACDDADLMLPIADRLVVMRQGAVVLDGAPIELLSGDLVWETGVGSTDAATIAHLAEWPAPLPLTRGGLLDAIRRPAPVAPVEDLPQVGEGSAAALLAMHDVTFHYAADAVVLRGVSLTVGAGEAVGLFGANGAGKSTLLRLAMALEQPTRGLIDTLGTATRFRHPEDFAPRVGFLFQQPERQLFAASVFAECALAPRLVGWSESRINSAVVDVLEELGLSDTREQHPYDLPVARRRLVALAAVLTADPELLLLDEPTAGLDSASRQRVERVIRERVRRGRGVLAITHDASFAHEALQRALVLSGGEIVKDCAVRDVLDDQRLIRPAALAVAMQLNIPAGRDRMLEVAQTLRNV